MDLPNPQEDATGTMGTLFAEELGLVLEVDAGQESAVLQAYRAAGVNATRIGTVAAKRQIEVVVDGQFAVAGVDWCIRGFCEVVAVLTLQRVVAVCCCPQQCMRVREHPDR